MAVIIMSYEIVAEGSCVLGHGVWSYSMTYTNPELDVSFSSSNQGSSEGTTARQMGLMAILKALEAVKAQEYSGTIMVRCDCEWCVKCLSQEYDCVSDDKFKKDKVARGYVQYIQEIWWKTSGLNVRYELLTS
jgi:ribonuclease HI